jgi:segregation and condensation protein B
MSKPPLNSPGGQPSSEPPAKEEAAALSLAALGAAYAQLMERPPLPRAASPTAALHAPGLPCEKDHGMLAIQDLQNVTPQSVLEAMLFVGNPNNAALTTQQVAALLRGVSPVEVAEMVAALNRAYDEEGRPYRIESTGSGFLLRLLGQYARLRDRFHGRVRQARLSQAAIDVLAIVAYQQPLSREQVEQVRGRPSGGVLNQLVSRGLLRIERPEPHRPHYCTTERFLQLFGLESLVELPKSHDQDLVF